MRHSAPPLLFFTGLFALTLGCSSSSSSGEPLGSPCTSADSCPNVACSCNDGASDDYGQECSNGTCATQSACTRLHGLCAHNGGVIGGPTGEQECQQDDDCTIARECPANTPGSCGRVFECLNGYCLWDDACAGATNACP